MSVESQIEALELAPDRLSTVEFSREEMAMIMNQNPDSPKTSVANFNVMAAFLVEHIGFFEEEVTEWFRENDKRLGGRSRLEVWPDEDGFEEVFTRALEIKREIDEDLLDDELKNGKLTANL
ncbi:MAG TPA: hypothetical protein VFX86_01475 [Candidatus Saccharimonadales bacterium]|nr:hypothetical protein [Candidatus Saccharimonadales bacterium]